MELTVKNILETLLFVTKKPLSLEELTKVIQAPLEAIQDQLEKLREEYRERGIAIIEVAGGWSMCTRPQYADYIDKLLHSPVETTLSPSALETLAIIAYKQPATRPLIEKIRGVISDSVIKTLLEKRLVKELGRGDGVGRPILYGTTNEFLRHFGLKDLSELPPLSQEGLAETAIPQLSEEPQKRSL